MNEDDLEDLIEEKVKEQLSKDFDKEVSEEIKQPDQNSGGEPQNIGRREFMRKVSAGVAGMGALAMIPQVAGFDITSNKPLNIYNKDDKSPSFTANAQNNSIEVENIRSDSISENRVFDTAGRFHGELTGSNDAQVLIDAIEDRKGEEGIIVPDTGFELDWEQQVNLPRKEQGFTLESRGMPKIVPSSNFEGSAFIKKPPASDAGNREVMGYNIGSFFIDDRPNQVLDWGLILDDIKNSYIAPSHFFGCPGIHMPASNFWTNQNMIDKPSIISQRGPGIKLSANPFAEDNHGADQNWVLSPYFNQTAWAEEDQTAFIDEARGNTWAFSRCEFAGKVHEQRSARRYTIIEGQWDRDDSYNITVNETGKFTYGKIWTRNYAGYKKASIINPNTQVFNAGRTGRKIEPVDFGKTTLSRSVEDLGFSDISNGGSTNIENRGYSSPLITMKSESNGDTAEIDLGGGNSYTPGVCPKFYLNLRIPNTSNIVFRAGIYRNDSEYGEIIYDPENSLEGSDFGSNWGIRVKIGNSIADESQFNMGPTSGETQQISIQRLLDKGKGDPDAVFHGNLVDSDNSSYKKRASNNGTSMARCNVRIKLENIGSSQKEVLLVPNRKLTMWSRGS